MVEHEPAVVFAAIRCLMDKIEAVGKIVVGSDSLSVPAIDAAAKCLGKRAALQRIGADTLQRSLRVVEIKPNPAVILARIGEECVVPGGLHHFQQIRTGHGQRLRIPVQLASIRRDATFPLIMFSASAKLPPLVKMDQDAVI